MADERGRVREGAGPQAAAAAILADALRPVLPQQQHARGAARDTPATQQSERHASRCGSRRVRQTALADCRRRRPRGDCRCCGGMLRAQQQQRRGDGWAAAGLASLEALAIALESSIRWFYQPPDQPRGASHRELNAQQAAALTSTTSSTTAKSDAAAAPAQAAVCATAASATTTTSQYPSSQADDVPPPPGPPPKARRSGRASRDRPDDNEEGGGNVAFDVAVTSASSSSSDAKPAPQPQQLLTPLPLFAAPPNSHPPMLGPSNALEPLAEVPTPPSSWAAPPANRSRAATVRPPIGRSCVLPLIRIRRGISIRGGRRTIIGTAARVGSLARRRRLSRFAAPSQPRGLRIPPAGAREGDRSF